MKVFADIYQDKYSNALYIVDRQTDKVYLLKQQTFNGLGVFDWGGLINAVVPTTIEIIGSDRRHKQALEAQDRYMQLAQSMQLNQQLSNAIVSANNQEPQNANDSQGKTIMILGLGALALTLGVVVVKRLSN